MSIKCVIGIDQSYTRTGYAVAIDNKIVEYGSLDFYGKETHIVKRLRLKLLVDRLITKYRNYSDELFIITERDNSKHRLVIKNSAELTCVIVDKAINYDINVYSVVASAWKSKIIPKKYGKPDDYKDERKPNKMPQLMFCEKSLDIDLKEYNKNNEIRLDKSGRIYYNDDVADAIGIALYGFVDSKLQKLQKEE